MMTGLAAKLRLKIHYLDETSAYLNVQLKCGTFMDCLDYFEKNLELVISENSNRDKGTKAAWVHKSINKGNTVCFLKKSLYGYSKQVHVGLLN